MIPAAWLFTPELAPPSGRQRFRETITRPFAAMACFGANAVVLVVSSVPLTLRAAYATRFCTCGDLRAHEGDVPFSLSRHDLSRGLTDDGAIEAERDAPDELRHFGLGERIVGARGAGLRTLDARLDARDRQGFVGVLDLLASVEVQHSPNQLLRALRCGHGRRSGNGGSMRSSHVSPRRLLIRCTGCASAHR
jgi:hypothetical protein